MVKGFIGLLISWFLSLSVFAQPINRQTRLRSKPPESSLNCDAPQTQVEMNLCAQMRFQKADEELNAVYRQLMGLLMKEEKSIVTQAQRYWLMYRDAHCRMYEKIYEGSPSVAMALSSCREEATLNRIKEIKALVAEKKLR